MLNRRSFKDIQATLARMEVSFDSFFNEQDLYDQGLVDEVVELLRKKGLSMRKTGLCWFKATAMGG